MALNDRTNVTLHRIGLGERDSEVPFYTSTRNPGLGTVVQDDSLSIRSEITIRNGDRAVDDLKIGPIAALKIDVQGFEPDVLRGLRNTLLRDKPTVWVELNPHVPI